IDGRLRARAVRRPGRGRHRRGPCGMEGGVWRRDRSDGRGDGKAGSEAVAHCGCDRAVHRPRILRSEEHTSELQSLMRISYAVFCLKKKKNNTDNKSKRQ